MTAQLVTASLLHGRPGNNPTCSFGSSTADVLYIEKDRYSLAEGVCCLNQDAWVQVLRRDRIWQSARSQALPLPITSLTASGAGF